ARPSRPARGKPRAGTPAPYLTTPRPKLNWRVLSTDPVLADQMKKRGLRAGDFDEYFARSGGPGGQHVNKVSTAVTVIYRPLGISVTAQETRSQYRNRQLAIH